MRALCFIAVVTSVISGVACRPDECATAQASSAQAALITFAKHATTTAPPSSGASPGILSPPGVQMPMGETARDTERPPRGYFRLEAETQTDPEIGHVVLLTEPHSGMVVPIFIGGTESLSIRLRLHHRRYSRPLTHDLFDEMLRRLGGKVLWAQVDAIDAGVYTGTLVVGTKTEQIALDARPSDAIALAIGNRAPIYVSQEVLTVAGFSPKKNYDKARGPRTEPLAL